MKKDKIINEKMVRLWTALVFIASFIIILVCSYLVNSNQNQKMNSAIYTAETTVYRLKAQLNKYLSHSDLIKHIIESGYDINDNEFSKLSSLMEDSNQIIEAYELAKDGVVSQIYPFKGNEEALGLDMLKNTDRKKEATLAKDSGEYTIAGPFELVQGGKGALLFDPIYTVNDNGDENFWGFSILVINWDNFISEIELDKLEDAGYHYQIWKKDLYTGEKIVIAQEQNFNINDTLQVACEVPNDTWYFEIAPVNGWISNSQIIAGVFAALIVSLLLSLGFWQFTERRRREALHALELEASAKEARDANEAKTRFLFNMSHDIRTPMNAIIGFSDLLEKNIDDTEKARNYVGKIKSSSNFLLSLINYVLEMARIESGKTTLKEENGNLRTLTMSLSTIFEPTIKQKNLTYNCTLDIQHEHIVCDKTKLREIFLNIISNSLKYTPDGGDVSVHITETSASNDALATYKIIIADTSIGMNKDYLPHIFEKFTREHTSTESKVVGTGLGLPIVKSLIDLMNGTIDVESEVGKGTRTTIVLTFPVSTDTQNSEISESEQQNITQALRGKRILLAEDNELNAEIAMTILEEYGMEIKHVEDGIMCVAELQKKPENYYSAILMDIQMSNMNGYAATQVIRNLKNQRASIPIIAMTANAFDEDKQKAKDAGMDAHIAKPINIEVLLKTLYQML